MTDAKRDPVCGAEVDRTKAVSIKHQGKEYSFCSPECRDKFKNDPARYGAGAA